ncbi:hypothetical protein ACNOYE_07740 [Nannocystaceae bacterium ST9]
MRHALEDREQAGRPPRWVRLARGAQFKQETLGSIVGGAVNGMAETLAYMAELTLDLEELLFQTDAAKAMADVMLKLIEAATDANFQAGIQTLVGVNSLGDLGSAMTAVNTAATEVQKYLDYIPEPEDVRGLGHELYRMLCITQIAFPRKANDNSIDATNADLLKENHLVIDDSGKVRLCAWAYAHGVTTRGIGANEANEKELFTFGSRRLFATASNSDLPQKAAMTFVDGDEKIKIYEFDFNSADNAKKAKDIAELVDLLQKHGYNAPVMAVGEDNIESTIHDNLMKFQAINELPITGEIDNDTINRLMNLDFARKNLRRAKPFDNAFIFPFGVNPTPKPIEGELKLVNPTADEFVDEGLALVPRTPHPYYIVPLSPAGVLPPNKTNWPKQQGWISDPSTNVRGFVALRSRARQLNGAVPGRFVGGRFSEGEAAHGSFFFAARHVEPWIDARQGAAGPDAVFPAIPANTPAPAISRMYQWIELPSFLDQANNANKPDGAANWELFVYASVLQRSLFTDRGATGFPDRGLIRVEIYGADGFTSTITIRDFSKVKASIGTELFPDHATTTAAMQLAEVDSKRLWTLRTTPQVKVPADAKAICLVAEGVHQSALDIDAYFDDFKIQYVWKKIVP